MCVNQPKLLGDSAVYYIVHPLTWWSYKRSFYNFADAYMIQQLVAPDAGIEYFDGVRSDVCWNPAWEYSCC